MKFLASSRPASCTVWELLDGDEESSSSMAIIRAFRLYDSRNINLDRQPSPTTTYNKNSRDGKTIFLDGEHNLAYKLRRRAVVQLQKG